MSKIKKGVKWKNEKQAAIIINGCQTAKKNKNAPLSVLHVKVRLHCCAVVLPKKTVQGGGYLPWYIIPRKKSPLVFFSLYLFIMHMFNMEITLLMLFAPWYFNCSLNFYTTKWQCIFYLINNDHESSGSLWFCVYKLFLHLDLFFVTTFVSPWF